MPSIAENLPFGVTGSRGAVRHLISISRGLPHSVCSAKLTAAADLNDRRPVCERCTTTAATLPAIYGPAAPRKWAVRHVDTMQEAGRFFTRAQAQQWAAFEHDTDPEEWLTVDEEPS